MYRTLAACLLLFATAAPAFAQARLRVLVYHDMEGLSGQDDWRTFDFDFPEPYRRGRELLLGDLRAVIDGLYEGGATEVHLVDGHASGNPDPDVPEGALGPRVTQVFRETPFRQYVDLVAPGAYDAVVAVGMHAKTGSRGFASHTFDMGIELLVNGRSVTETELIGYSWGRVGTPVILVTGDDRLREDLRGTMPWLEYVVVKRATSASSAALRPVEEVHREMRAAAARAVKGLGAARAMRLDGPLAGGVRAVPPSNFGLLRNVPGIDLRADTVHFRATDFAALYDGWVSLVGVATAAHAGMLRETVRTLPGGDTVLVRNNERLTGRWLDVESGRWSPPAPTPRKRYHGAR